MTEYETASLVTQIITTAATVAAVLVALIFGWLTLRNSRLSKDNQERATYAAADSDAPMPAEFAQAVREVRQVDWVVERERGESWLLRQVGGSAAYDVHVAGLTELDQRRLKVVADAGDIGPTGVVPFTYVSRLSLSGPGNIVVTFRVEKDGPESRRVVRIPAP
jgi:hypothetical protein